MCDVASLVTRMTVMSSHTASGHSDSRRCNVTRFVSGNSVYLLSVLLSTLPLRWSSTVNYINNYIKPTSVRVGGGNVTRSVNLIPRSSFLPNVTRLCDVAKGCRVVSMATVTWPAGANVTYDNWRLWFTIACWLRASYIYRPYITVAAVIVTYLQFQIKLCFTCTFTELISLILLKLSDEKWTFSIWHWTLTLTCNGM